MKSIVIISSIVTVPLIIYSRSALREQHVHDPLPSGQVNADVQQIGLNRALRTDANIYFRTNFTSCGQLLDSSERHRFDDATVAPAVLIRWNDGKEEWLKRTEIDRCWIEE